MQRNLIIATLAAAGVIAGGVVAGTALAEDDSARGTPSTLRAASAADRDDDTDDDGAGSGSVEDRVSAAQAVQRALEEAPGVVAGLEREDDGRVWEVDVVGKDGGWRLVEIDRSSGEVVANRAERDDDDDRRDAEYVRKLLTGASNGAGDAARLAAGKADGPIEEIELDDRGTTWKVEFDGQDDDRELRVDLASGRIAVLGDDDRDDRDGDDDRDEHGDDGDEHDDR